MRVKRVQFQVLLLFSFSLYLRLVDLFFLGLCSILILLHIWKEYMQTYAFFALNKNAYRRERIDLYYLNIYHFLDMHERGCYTYILR